MKDMYAIVLAYNHWEDTRECLDSLVASCPASVQLAVVDNGSTDGTGDKVRANYPEVELVTLKENAQIIGGYNAGMGKALADGFKYVLVMNNDTAAGPGMLAELQHVLDSDQRVGAVVPKILYYDDPRILWSAGARSSTFPPGPRFIGLNEPDGPRFSAPAEIEFATNCCIAVRADVLRTVGLFNRAYTFYYADWAFTLRIRQCGYKLMFVPQARLKHKVSMTTQKVDRPGYARIHGRDSVPFYLGNYGYGALAWMTLWVTVRQAVQGEANAVLPYLQGVIDGVRAFGSRGKTHGGMA